MGKPKPAKSTSTTNQITTNAPYAPAEPLLQDMLSRAGTAIQQTPTTPIFTGPNAIQQQAQDYLASFAPQASQGYDVLKQNALDTASGKFMENNPYIEQLISASQNPLREQLDANILSVGDAAKLAGAYGGDRQELARGTAVRGFNADAMQLAAGIRYDNYQRERQNQLAAAQQLQQANQIGMDPARILAALGDQQAGWDLSANQAAIDAPWTGLDRYAQLLGTVTPYGTQNVQGTTTTTGTPARPGGVQSGLSGALGGASAGAAFGPWGAGIGAVVGGLGGLFG